jgi:hypothetical protein
MKFLALLLLHHGLTPTPVHAYEQTWTDKHPTHRAEGAAWDAFWNGPLVPGFLMRFEEHLPVVARESDDG